jgi:hypothetical protein
MGFKKMHKHYLDIVMVGPKTKKSYNSVFINLKDQNLKFNLT